MLETMSQWPQQALVWANEYLLTRVVLAESLGIVAAMLLGWFLSVPLSRTLRKAYHGNLESAELGARFVRAMLRIMPWLLAALLMAGVEALVQGRGHEAHFLRAMDRALLAYCAVLLFGTTLLSRFWRRVVGIVVFVAVGLDVAGVLPLALSLLDTFGFQYGESWISPVTLVKGILVLLVMIRVGNWLSEIVERRMSHMNEVSPSMHVLVGKVIRISVIVIAALAALGSMGVTLTALSVFSGAVGVGLGFGLRNVFANLVSGFILLMDKSIKPGDVIEIGEVYGWIRELRARFVSVVTRDGTEYLIPNESLITNQVVNWSFSDTKVRLKLSVGVAYGTDVRMVMGLMEKAAHSVDRVLSDPEPKARFIRFGDSSLDLELRAWIDDPQEGLVNVKSDIGLAILDGFSAAGVVIPFPQRDVHFVSKDTTEPDKA